MNNRLTTQQLEQTVTSISSMINGLDIALERVKELKGRFVWHYEPFENSEGLLFSLDVLLGILRQDRTELKAAFKKAQKALWAKIG